MKRTAWIGAAALAGALLTGMSALASSDENQKAAGWDDAGAWETQDGMAEAAKSLAAAGAFLTEKTFAPTVKYVPYPLPEGLEGALCPLGQIQLRRDGRLLTADVVNFSLTDSETGGRLGGLFGAEEDAGPGDALLVFLFNQMLERAPEAINGKILETVSQLRKTTGEAIPYSIARVDFRSVEPLRRLSGRHAVYTAGMRVLIYADGWVFPMYVRAYIDKKGEAYRVIGLFAGDSQKDAAMEGGRFLAEDLMDK